MQLHSLVAQDYWLAEARQHQHEEALPLRLIELKDTFPACEDRPAHLDGVGVLDHHVHDGDGQLVDKVAAVGVPKVEDAGYLVVVVLVQLHQHVEVVEVTVIYACGTHRDQTQAVGASSSDEVSALLLTTVWYVFLQTQKCAFCFFIVSYIYFLLRHQAVRGSV